MTAIEEIRQSLDAHLTQLNAIIAQSLDSSDSMMNRVIESYLAHKGKQLRPMLVLLTARLLGGDPAGSALTAAAAVEMLHNASLIHDDVVDESKTRHSHETINAVWDNHIAVLIGDFFVARALEMAIDTGDMRVIRTLARLGATLSEGEMHQIHNAIDRRLDEDAYFAIISRKTASLFVSCAQMGAYCSGIAEDDPRFAAISRFAELFGLCFQIKDDTFDYFDDDKEIGKPTGNDLREGKVTLPLIHAFRACPDAPRRESMASLLDRDTLSPADIVQLIYFAREAGGIEYAYSTMERLRAEGAEALAPYFTPEATAPLLSLFDFVISRSR